MKSYLFLILLIVGATKSSLAQHINDYKYILVPEKFEFQSEKDEYQLNSLTAFLFEKNGFQVVPVQSEFPKELKNNPCAALNVEVRSGSGTFSLATNVVIILKNCSQQIIFQSEEGKSKLKDIKFGYQEALRDAFSSIEALEYSYSGPTKPVHPEISDEAPKTPKETGADLVYSHEGKNFLLEKKKEGFLLKTEDGESAAILNKTSRDNFIFRAGTINGTAYFDANGDLIVEYFNVQKEKMIKRVYSRR